MTTADLFHGGDRPRQAMEERLEALFRARGDVPARWVPRRLILQNYWLYPYQEFHFGNGRLVLRGPNGSGKTSVLVSAVTLVLDAEKGRSRLDPFRQGGRSIAYYLLGKKDAEQGGGFYHEDRTGYVALEFQHGGDGRFLTIGLGMRGRRLSGGGTPRVDSWGFVLKDGGRVGRGRDLELTTPEHVPLTRMELAERVGGGGVVLDRVSDYRAEVNRALFGFAEDDDYAFLVQILLALRSPKLNKELKPSDVADILSESLPPLDPALLDRVTQVMDDIDATRVDIATTEANHTLVERVHQAVARHANQVAQERALVYREREAAVDDVLEALVDARQRASSARDGREAAEARLQAVDEERADLRGRLQILRQHEAYRSEDALRDAAKDAARATSHQDATETAVRAAQADMVSTEKRRSGLRDRWTGSRKAAREHAGLMVEAAGRAVWAHAQQTAAGLVAELSTLEFDGREPPGLTAGAIAELAADRKGRLTQVVEALTGVEHAEVQLERARAGVEHARAALEEGHGESRTSYDEVDTRRGVVVSRLERWRTEVEELAVPRPLVTDVRQSLHLADEAMQLTAELFEPLRALASRRRGELEADREERLARSSVLRLRRAEAGEELELWEQRDEAVPEPRAGQDEARVSLTARGVVAVPLFRAVEVRSPAGDGKTALGAALLESGLLDALIVRPGDEATTEEALGGLAADRWIRPRPLPEGTATLADVLEPAPCELSDATILEALRSVALASDAEDGSAGVGPDGRWRLGLLRGRVSAPGEHAPSYLGREARIQERERQVARLGTVVRALDEELEAVQEEIRTLTGRLGRLDREINVIRELPELAALAGALNVWAERRRQVQRLSERLQEAERRTDAARREVGDAKQAHERTLRHAPEARGFDADGVGGLVVAGEDVVSMAQRVADRLETLQDQAAELRRVQADMARRGVVLENARARQREAAEAVRVAKGRLAVIETELRDLGYEEISDQVRRAEERAEALEREGRELAGTRDRLAERLDHIEADVAEREDRRADLEEQRAEARDRLAAAVVAYPTLHEAAALFGEGAEGAAGRTADHLLERRKDLPSDLRRRIEDDRKRAWQGLTQEVSESRSSLIDYHPSLDPDTGAVTFRDEGREVPPHALLEVLDRHRRLQTTVMREKEDELYEEFFLQEVSGSIRESIERAEESVKRVNALLSDRPLANDEVLWLRWTPLRDIGAGGADHPRLVALLRKPASVLPPEDVRWIKTFFRERVRSVREDAARAPDSDSDDQPSFAEALQAVLDYRRWFSFTIHGKRPDEAATEITNREFASRSGGEKSLAMFVPLLAASDARFQSAHSDAPKLVGLDEAFAGVDSDNINEMFAFMVSLDLSWIMTSEKLWGVGASLPTCTTYQFHRRGTVAAVRLWLWDGTRNVDGTSLVVAATGENAVGDEVGAA